MSKINDIIIPDGWKIERIDNICDVLDNLRIPVNSEEREKLKWKIPYYWANWLQWYINDYIFNEDLVLVAEDWWNFEDYQIRPIAYKISWKSWVNNHAHILKTKNWNNLDFFFYSIVNKNILSFIAWWTRSKLNQSELKNIKILIPQSPKEQEKIAEILSTVDEAIENTDRLIEKYKKIKTWLMEDFFINNHLWDERTIWEMLQNTVDNRGKTPPLSLEWKILVETYHINNDRTSLLNLKDNKQKYVSDETFNTFFRAGHPKKWDILFSLVWERIPQIFINNCTFEFCIWQNLVALRFKSIYNATFISYVMKHHKFKKNVKEIMMNNAQPSIKLTELIKLKIKIPNNIKEQEKIAEILTETDSKIEKEEAYKEKLEKIKKWLMNDLLTGKVRVKF